MLISADHPAWLGVGALLLLTGIVATVRTRGRSWRWRAAGLFLPLFAAASIAGALAQVSAAGEARVVILLDFSPSARAAAWHDPAWVRALAEKRLGGKPLVTVAAFHGGEVERLLEDVTPGDATRWPARWNAKENGDRASEQDVRHALAWRLPGESEGHQVAARWVITDGLFATPPLSSEMPLAWTLVPPEGIDAGVTALVLRSPDATDRAQVEVQTQVRVVGRAAAGKALPSVVHMRLEVMRDHVAVATVPLEFHTAAGTLDNARWVSVRDILPPAAAALPHEYETHATLVQAGTEGDAWPENDRAAATYVAPGELSTLVIGTREPSYPHTAFVQAERFFPTPEQLTVEGWQTVVLDDLTAEQVSPMMPSLNAAVTNNGMGLLILGNGHAFGPGHYDLAEGARGLEALSPVWSHPHAGRSTHVVFILDASASMNEAADDLTGAGKTLPTRKITLAASAMRGACELLAPQDRVTVITFNGAADGIADGPLGSIEADLPKKLAAVEPSGATSPDRAWAGVLAAFNGDANVPEVRKVAVLLTDGEIPSMDVPRWHAMLAAAGARLVMITPPASAGGPSVLRQLAAMPGASWSQSLSASDWAKDMQRAVAAEVSGTLQARAIHWTFDDAAVPLSGDARSWTRVWRKPEAVLLGEGADDERYPLVAVAQRGLGQVGAVAITNDESATYKELVTRMCRRVAGSGGDRRFTIACAHDDEGWRVVADGTDENGFLDGQSLAANVTYAGTERGEMTAIPLRQTAPGHYELLLRAGRPAFVTVERTTPGGTSLVGRVAVSTVETSEWPASVERVFYPAADVLLPPELDDPTQWQVPVTGRRELKSLFWMLAALAGLAALWVRR